MNKLTIIGNLTKDPELRTTSNGKNVCSFTVAVNRRNRQQGQDEADFFDVTTWKELADNCAKYLAQGKKVAVVGSVSLYQWESQNGKHGARLQVSATDVEFLSPKSEVQQQPVYNHPNVDEKSKMEVVETDDLPF